MGRRHRPFYRLNAVEKRTQRDGRVLETLGWYNPMAKDDQQRIELKEDRIKAWLERGAQPSNTVMDLLADAEIVDAEAWRNERERRRKKRYNAIIEQKKADEEAARAAEAAAKAEAEAAATAEAEDASASKEPAAEGEPSEDAEQPAS